MLQRSRFRFSSWTVLLLLAAACGGPADTRRNAMCVDPDGDGFGQGCAAGLDCAEGDPGVGGGEACDGKDNDCDQGVDESLADLCPNGNGGCVSGCKVWSDVFGDAEWDLSPGNSGNFDGVVVDSGNALTLARQGTGDCAVWIANTNAGTVSKLDCKTGQTLALYPSIGNVGPFQPGTLPSSSAACTGDAANAGNCPSRTAVTQAGNAVVANRAFYRQGSVTKYAGTPEGCRNGPTSTGGANFVGESDACILWTAAPAEFNNAWPRALAVGTVSLDGAEGTIWVGLWNTQQACALNPTTGALIQCVNLVPGGGAQFRPYGASALRNGNIAFVDRSKADSIILGFVTPAGQFQAAAPLPANLAACNEPYGMVPSSDGKIYIAENTCKTVLVYDTNTNQWSSSLGSGDPYGSGRGLAIDLSNQLYVALSGTSQVARFDLSLPGSQPRLDTINGCAAPWGACLALDGSVWVACQNSNNAARFDQNSKMWSVYNVGDKPYTYSDCAGGNLRLLVQEQGYFQFIAEGCESENMTWLGVAYRADVPPGTSVAIKVRTANKAEDFGNSRAGDFLGPFQGTLVDGRYQVSFQNASPPVPKGRFIQIRMELRTQDEMVAPRVFERPEAVGICGGATLL